MSYGYRCPFCGSENTESVPTIYAGGTVQTHGTSYTSGNTFYSGSSYNSYTGSTPHFGTAFNSAVSQHTNTSQTTLAKQLQPPAKKRIQPFRMFFILVLVEFLCAIAYASQGHQVYWPTWRFVGGVIFVAWLVLRSIRAFIYNHGRYKKLLRAWNDSMLCRRCGKCFVTG